jgi:hypothetical protein
MKKYLVWIGNITNAILDQNIKQNQKEKELTITVQSLSQRLSILENGDRQI